jgi:hypothetical protein
MTRYFISPVLFAVSMTIACSSSTTTNVTAEETGGNTSIETTAGSSGCASTSTGGSGNIGSTGCAITGGNGAGTTSGNTSTSCVPDKSCADIANAANSDTNVSGALACSDSCGDTCAQCPTGSSCGSAPTGNIGNQQGITWVGYGLTAAPNICGSRCVRSHSNSQAIYDVYNVCGSTYVWICPTIAAPIGKSCQQTENTLGSGITTWCCS